MTKCVETHTKAQFERACYGHRFQTASQSGMYQWFMLYPGFNAFF